MVCGRGWGWVAWSCHFTSILSLKACVLSWNMCIVITMPCRLTAPPTPPPPAAVTHMYLLQSTGTILHHGLAFVWWWWWCGSVSCDYLISLWQYIHTFIMFTIHAFYSLQKYIIRKIKKIFLERKYPQYTDIHCRLAVHMHHAAMFTFFTLAAR